MKIYRIRTVGRRSIAAGASLLFLATVCSWGAEGISAPLYVGNVVPLQDEFGRPMRGSPYPAGAASRPRIEIRVAYFHPFYQVYTNLPPGTNGASSPYNPLVTQTNQYNPTVPAGVVPADSIGGVGMNAAEANSGLFCLVYPKRPAQGLRIFARAYNAPTPEETTFYADSDVVEVASNASSLVFTFGALKALNPADSDGDELDDSWEALLGIDDRPTPDYDGDGMSDLHEMWAGTAPDDPDSKLSFRRVDRETVPTGRNADGEPTRQVLVKWQSVPGKTYRLEYVPTLVDATGEAMSFDLVTGGLVTAGAGEYEIEMQVDVSTNATGTFRVKLVRE